MPVRFWGTRGSIPVALTSADIRHEPAFNDERIQSILNETIRFEILTRHGRPLIVSAAFDGMEIDV